VAPLVNVIILLLTFSVSFWLLLISVLICARIVDTSTDFVSDGERKKITTRIMASVIRSNIKLVLIHFPLLDIRKPLYLQDK
jgi:hypothetical protein